MIFTEKDKEADNIYELYDRKVTREWWLFAIAIFTMDGWLDGWMDGWTDGWVDGGTTIVSIL